MHQMYLYQAFGLGLHSPLPLPELVEAPNAAVDVTIRWGKVNHFPASAARKAPYFCFSGEEAHLRWDGVAGFCVRNGREIIIDPSPHVEEEFIRLPLLGMVLAVLLLQRGRAVLHGSAMVVNGSAVAFLGDKGAGKSTLAMALYSAGHDFLTDDVVVVKWRDAAVATISPAFPQLKLWPDVASCPLGKQSVVLSSLYPHVEKRICHLTEHFLQQPVPLKQIYVLGISPRPEIRPLSHQDAVMEVIRNSYMARFDQVPRTFEAHHFDQCAELIKSISAYRLTYPSSLSLLPSITQLIEEHLAYCTYANAV